MKTRLLAGFVASLALIANLIAGPRDTQWKQVRDTAQKGLPKAAIEQLEPIIAGAIADREYAEAIKAIGQKITLEGYVQGNKAEEKIFRMQAEIEKAPAPMKPAMEAILAHWYWDFFQQNRWRFIKRTQTAETPGTDIQTWDLARILVEIDKHFSAALSDETTLKATPVTDYNDLIRIGNVPDSYRPTMFDFLAYEALGFYQAGEQGAIKAEDTFELDADSPIFGDALAFSQWQPPAHDDTSPILKAIRLYQKLLQFHQADTEPSAFFDADLARLSYGNNVAVGESKTERYEAALQRFIAATSSHEISARALATLAGRLHYAGEPARAHELARRGLAAFPESVGGAMCYNLIQQIEAKSSDLSTEFVWNAPWPTLDLTYRNVTKVYFRAVSVDFTDERQRRYGLYNRDANLSNKLLATLPTLAWEADLPPTTDYKSRTEKLPAPTSLKPGFYYIIASHDRDFSAKDNQVGIAPVWVSNLALVVESRDDNEPSGGFVLNADSGEPIPDATIRLWQRDQDGWLKPLGSTKTDANGRYLIPSHKSGGSLMVLAEHGSQAVSKEFWFQGANDKNHLYEQTIFFTDRAIFRPGQTINYKGVSYSYQINTRHYSVLAGRKLTVVFRDANGKEIARAKHTTNDYGSFSGIFTAPRDRLTGNMSLIVENAPVGGTSISVEEYKRPKFQVELAPPAEAAKLDAPVNLTGTATAYTGAALGGAMVKWRVERGVQLPSWCWWWQPAPNKAVAHGTAVSEADGRFKIQFIAAPDRTVPEKNEPVFTFTLHVDVTDATGETRSSDRIVRAGYTALRASVTADEWQTTDRPVELKVATQSLDGHPQSASGTVTVYTLKEPSAVERAPSETDNSWLDLDGQESKLLPANRASWENAASVTQQPFKTDSTGQTRLTSALKAGIYRAVLETEDRFGRKSTARSVIQVVDPHDKHFREKIPNYFSAPKWSVEPGDKFTAMWGTGYDRGRAFVELECNGRTLQSYWTAADRTQAQVELPVTEEMRGGVTVRVTCVRENRAYFNQRIVDVPWTEQDLTVKWERFRSKLLPGQKETWSAIVTGPDAQRTAAEMVATLYDASLDQYRRQSWPQRFGVFRQETAYMNLQISNNPLHFQTILHGWQTSSKSADWQYRNFPEELQCEEWVVLTPFEVASGADTGYRASATLAGTRINTELRNKGSPNAAVSREFLQDVGATDANPLLAYTTNSEVGGMHESLPKPDLSKVTARKNLNETAFFFPHLLADTDGVVKLQFTMPEALTEWKFMGFAHDKYLRSGFITDKVVTAKELMVEPNPPRFVREGDAIEFTVKVSNQSDKPQKGKVRLTFADAATLASVDAALGNRATEQSFDVPAKQSRSYSWRIAVPDGMGFLTYKAVGATAENSDGEEGFLPVLSRRILVTESLPLPIRGKTTKEFDFNKLLDSAKSDSIRNQSLTVQMVSRPAWYAVMALPYLMEYPYECSEQLFNRFYANALARHIAKSDPKIRRIFDLWKDTPALDSPLMKNQDLKSVMLEETPWLRQANAESESRRNVGLLFDPNRLDDESARTLGQLAERQLSDGLWSWFPGGRSDEYISLYIVTGFGRMRHLGVEIDVAPALKALAGLDEWMFRQYLKEISRPHPEEYVPSHSDAIYLYARSFFLKDQPLNGAHQPMIDFYLRQSRRYWLQTDCRMCQAQLALALQRFGDTGTPMAIMKSLKERSVSTEELGRFWRDTESGWWWWQAPIETQATMIEAFAEVTHDTQAVEDCKVWLLKQKQTQDWKTTKATADAVYALLLRGDNLLSSDALVEVSLGGKMIKPEKIEVGTGFYEQKFVRAEIKPAMGHITVKKVDDGVSWGSAHWQYLEDMTKVTPHEGTPLKLKKTLWAKETTNKGQMLKPVTGPLSVGDELVVRLELRTDRDMEYVHLKDQRGSGTEPVNVLSRYKYQDGLGYYESTRDTASHFFIDYLPKGIYVFEYSMRIQLKGNYQSGIAEIQCMYAPEFNSHSESFTLEVK